jgi:hypothetical protein
MEGDPMQRSVSLSHLQQSHSSADQWKANTERSYAAAQWLPQSCHSADAAFGQPPRPLYHDAALLESSFLTSKGAELGVTSADFPMLDPYDDLLGLAEGV